MWAAYPEAAEHDPPTAQTGDGDQAACRRCDVDWRARQSEVEVDTNRGVILDMDGVLIDSEPLHSCSRIQLGGADVIVDDLGRVELGTLVPSAR